MKKYRLVGIVFHVDAGGGKCTSLRRKLFPENMHLSNIMLILLFISKYFPEKIQLAILIMLLL